MMRSHEAQNASAPATTCRAVERTTVGWWRVENVLIGGTILFWSVRGTIHSPDRTSPVLWAMLALNVCVGSLILARLKARRRGNWKTTAAALPSVGMGFLAWQLAPPPATWPLVAQGLFVGGCLLAVCAFLTLGRSFAVLPSVRTIVTTGPYRFVRHPAYGGELLLAASCLVAHPSWLTSIPLLLAIPFTIVRIQAEERLLKSDPDYLDYVRLVRRRLAPGVW